MIRVPAEKAIRAIVGEAEGEGYSGMLGVACALRNRAKSPAYRRRGVFFGVFGLKRELHFSPGLEVAQINARRAWKASATVDVTNGATVWGSDRDIEKFARQGWLKRCTETIKIGNHHFYRENS